MNKLRLLLLVMLILLCSCQLQKVMVNVYTPANLAFPPELRTVLITSRYVPATGPYEDVQWGAYESVDSLKWKLSESIIDSLGKRMVAGNTFLVKVKHLMRILRHNEANLPDVLGWDGLSNLSNKEYVQAILILEGFGLAKTPVVVDEENGNFIAHYSVDVILAIRLYEPGKMRMIDDSLYTFSTEFKGTGKTGQEAGKQLPDDQKALRMACSNAADAYFALIKPGEVAAKRFYYNDGDSSMLKATQALKEGKWGRAESKWKWLAYNSKDSVIQAKASFNMALACERDGRINQAMGFAGRSQRLKPDNHTLKYIKILDRKTLDYEDQLKQKKMIKKW